MFKIMKGLEVSKCGKDLNIKERTRGHTLSYKKDSFKSRRRIDFAFFCCRETQLFRVAPNWNVLPPNVVNSSSLKQL